MIPLPNDHWVRSPKMPEFALCFDPHNRFFLWKMVENEAGDTWSSVSRLTTRDLHFILLSMDPTLQPFKHVISEYLLQSSAQTRAC